ncbi:MAG TPA: TraM recognition domain-containing protein [Pseudonocardia sp.]|jgi:type IV secretory pathway TraG/TraD family ATPase VirD4|nr:TraM recognition domain-containing protein [Pseudonocardia sp.]
MNTANSSSTSSVISPAGDRDLLLAAVVTALAAALLGAVACVMCAAALTCWISGAPTGVPTPGTWFAVALRLLADPAHPGAAFGLPWEPVLTARHVLYWAVAAATLLVYIVVGGALVIVGWRLHGPTPPGHASRAEIRSQLSPRAARRTARWTRPSLSIAERRAAPLTELAAPLHRGPTGRMWVPFENPTGTIAPTQSGKTRRDLVHKGLDAPAALLCSTTKADLIEMIGLARTRRPNAGPVLVYDATGTVSWPAQLRWSPITGCTDPATSYRRARAMVEAAAVTVEAGGPGGAGNDRVFRERATMVLSAYLLAAALSGHQMRSVLKWATEKPLTDEAAKLLAPHFPVLAKNLQTETKMVARTADAVWMSVRRVVEPLTNPTLLALCTPAPHEAFDAATFIRQNGSLFLIAGQHQAAQVAPLLTALADYWLTTAQDLALTYPARRLDPPATAVLDELPNATPLPELPDIVSDSAGRGVIIHWAAQSLAQLEDTYGATRARQLLDNTTTLTTFGALKDSRALEWLSTLTGHHDRPRWQHHTDAFLTPGRTSIGSESVPTYRPGDIRSLQPGEVLVIHRHLKPIRARTIDVAARPDWPQLHADTTTLRSGEVPVTPDGKAIHAVANTDNRTSRGGRR